MKRGGGQIMVCLHTNTLEEINANYRPYYNIENIICMKVFNARIAVKERYRQFDITLTCRNLPSAVCKLADSA